MTFYVSLMLMKSRFIIDATFVKLNQLKAQTLVSHPKELDPLIAHQLSRMYFHMVLFSKLLA